ncbi:hypothetical protein [Amycolatopsis minnesotensis]|uniref:hypothetical protein n=1 Tax=Amycolatopsis minnesotensis TaxID=337894 RepID=UPI0031D229E7
MRELHLRGNRITRPPSASGSLAELRQLDLRDNGLIELPPSLLELSPLDNLDLRWNKHLRLPSWLPACARSRAGTARVRRR